LEKLRNVEIEKIAAQRIAWKKSSREPAFNEKETK
jgi:hypothetical protein